MRIESYQDLIHEVNQAVTAYDPTLNDKFKNGVCHGFAAAFLEAALKGPDNISSFKARLQGTLAEPPEQRSKFFLGLAARQKSNLFPELFPPETSYKLHNVEAIPSIVSGGETPQQGVVRSLFRAVTFCDQYGLLACLMAIQDLVKSHRITVGFILKVLEHAIPLYFEGDLVQLANSSAPLEFSSDRLENSLPKIWQALTISTAPVVLMWEWICSRDDYLNLSVASEDLKKHPAFNQPFVQPTLNLFHGAIMVRQSALVFDILRLAPTFKEEAIGLFSAMTYTVSCGLDQEVEILLKAGADPNRRDSSKYCPLEHAVRIRGVSLVKLLLDFGADPLNTDEYGISPLSYARGKRDEEKKPVCIEKYKEIIVMMENNALKL